MANRLRFGPPPGAAGVVVYQDAATSPVVSSEFGTTAAIGVLKRGPMGEVIPVSGSRGYHSLYGDPLDKNWHLFGNSEHLTPDWVDSYFDNGGGDALLLMTRLELDGTAKRAELTLKGRNGLEVLKIKAANEGRWGGMRSTIAATSVVAASVRTFTVVAPGVLTNEYADGIVKFSSSNTEYKIVSNTKADSRGEATFTVAAQYNLFADGIAGPTAIAGAVASYTSKTALTGTVAIPRKVNAAGTLSTNGRQALGVGTTFTTDYAPGDFLYFGNETRIVESVASDTTLTLVQSFVFDLAGATVQKDNRVVTGTGTAFTTDLAVGDMLYVNIGGNYVGRRIAAIASATSLTLTSSFPLAVAAGATAYKQSYTVTATGTPFTPALVGRYIIDPSRAGAAVRVTATTATTLTIDKPFSADFSGTTLYQQYQTAEIRLAPPRSVDGLAVEIVQGVQKPATHFGIAVYFNGSQVLQVDDCSLDPGDKDFVNKKVAQANIGYSTGSINYAQWIEAESLWNSTYTTAPGSDVRPTNGSDTVLAVSANKIYTVADIAYTSLPGTIFYPSIYNLPTTYHRVVEAQAPSSLVGTFVSIGTAVTGSGTTFTTDLNPGDYIYDSGSKTVRQVKTVVSDTSIVLVGAFATDVSVPTAPVKAGYVAISANQTFASGVAVGDTFNTIVRQYLAGGYDGNTAATDAAYWTKYADLDYNAIEDVAGNLQLGMVRVACPGISDVQVQQAFINYCLLRAYEYRVEIPSYMNPQSAISFVRQTLGASDGMSVAYPSYGYAIDDSGTVERLVPTTGSVMGGEAKKAVAEQGYHKAFSGTDASLSTRISRLAYKINSREEADLNQAGIQPIKSNQGRFIVFGARGPAASEQFKYLHNSRIQKNLIRVFRESVETLSLVFSPNDPVTVTQLVFILEAYAKQEYRKGVFSRFLPFNTSVQISDLGNVTTIGDGQDLTQSLVRLESGKISIQFRYVPSGLIEVIEVFVNPLVNAGQFGNAVNTAF